MSNIPTNKVAVAACPFCGGTDTACGIADEEFGRFWVECICGARGPTVETLKDARPAWNKRLAPEPVAKRIGCDWPGCNRSAHRSTCHGGDYMTVCRCSCHALTTPEASEPDADDAKSEAHSRLMRALHEWQNAGGSVDEVADSVRQMAEACSSTTKGASDVQD